MATLTESQKLEIVHKYLRGERLVPLAREYRKRAQNISEILIEAGIDVSQESRFRSSLVRSRPNKIIANKSAGITRQLSDTDWAYIAGIFDGEGSISPIKKKDRYTGWQLSITQKKGDLLPWVQEKMGVGNIRENRKEEVVQCDSLALTQQRQIFDFLEGVMPYLIVKREKAEFVLKDLVEKYDWRTKCLQEA